MFGIKLSPDRIIGSLKAFGIDINALVPKIQNEIIKKLSDAEDAAGCRLITTAVLDESKTFFIVSLYKDKGSGNLELFKSFDLKNPLEFLENLKNTENDTEHLTSGSATAALPGSAADTGTGSGA